MFDFVPLADVYVLKSVLHNWDDDHCRQLLSVLRNNAEQRTRSTGQPVRILLIEHVLPPPAGEHKHAVIDNLFVLSMDLRMAVHFGAKERSVVEFVELAAAAGLRLKATAPLPSTNYHWIEFEIA